MKDIKELAGFRYSQPTDLVEMSVECGEKEFTNLKVIQNSLLDFMNEENIFNSNVKATKDKLFVTFYAYSTDEIYYLNEIIVSFLFDENMIGVDNQIYIRVNKRVLPPPPAITSPAS